MVFAVAFLLNSAGNFVIGIVLGALLGPAEFGRYATVTLAALTLAGGAFDWLRLSTIRFSGYGDQRVSFASSLEAAYLVVAAALYVAVAIAWLCGLDFGFGPILLWLTPFFTVAVSRVDYAAAQFRARGLARAFAAIFTLRQTFCFAAAAVVAYVRRDAATAVAAMAMANLAAAIALGGALRVPGARLAAARGRDVVQFLVYAKPLVASMVIYALISLINRQVAFERLGAAETGEFSLAFDLSQRLFQAIYALPEILLFQYALQRDRDEGRAAAEAQVAANVVLSLAILLPAVAGYFALGPTFEALIVPSAYRGEFTRISLALAPGLLCYGGLTVAVNPVFQLAKKTWPVTAAAAIALAVDLALLAFTDVGASVGGLARAYSLSLVVAALISAAIAFRRPAMRPNLRDLAIVVVAVAAMAAAVRPFNAIPSHAVAALGAIVVGGAIYGGALLAFDVAGLRAILADEARRCGTCLIAAASAIDALSRKSKRDSQLGGARGREKGTEATLAHSDAARRGPADAPEPSIVGASSPKVVIFGSAKPVTCAVMDYARRLCDAINAQRPGFVVVETIEPDKPFAFVGAVVKALRAGAVAHFELPIEGWGNSVVPGSALMAARLLTRKGRVAMTMHEWTSLNPLRYLSTIPDFLAADGFIFVSPREREAFLATPWAARAKKDAALVIPIGPNIMPVRVDGARVAEERMRTRGEGAARADVVIGFFGVLYASKRPDLLLRVVRTLLDRGVKARLLVCGDFLWDKPKDRGAFLDLARELGVAEWLDFRGRIDDEGELMATLSASEVFLLPYADGVSARRGSFQAVSQLAIPLVTTAPARPDEFDPLPSLKRKIDSSATALVPADARPEDFAEAVMAVLPQKDRAIGVSLDAIWREAATNHLAFYDRLLGRGEAARDDGSGGALRLDAAEWRSARAERMTGARRSRAR